MSARRPSMEWWALIDPKTDTWARVTEEEALHFPAVECRSTVAFTDKVVGLYEEAPA